MAESKKSRFKLVRNIQHEVHGVNVTVRKYNKMRAAIIDRVHKT